MRAPLPAEDRMVSIVDRELRTALPRVLREGEVIYMSTGELTDVRYEIDNGLAWITIDRPERYNSLRSQTLLELLRCFAAAWDDPKVGVIALTGAGERAFCPGHDAKEGEADPKLREVDALHRIIRDIPKPVIAAVNGDAVGGGHVLHVVCDFTIASQTARFGQVGPRVGSVDIAFGCSVLVRIVGEKRAREIWSLCELFDAATAERWGLVNKVVPSVELRGEVRAWADRLLAKSPTALALVKHTLNQGSEPRAGFVAYDMLRAYRASDESVEGRTAFIEKRPPNFDSFRT